MKPLIITLNLLCGADATTTHYALQHGAREVVMPSQNPWVLDGVAASAAISESSLLVWLDRRGHGKAARIVGWSFVGIRAAVVASNLRQIRR